MGVSAKSTFNRRGRRRERAGEWRKKQGVLRRKREKLIQIEFLSGEKEEKLGFVRKEGEVGETAERVLFVSCAPECWFFRGLGACRLYSALTF